MTPEIIVNIDTDVGENPLWYKKENSLLWCDIPHIRHKEGFIYSYQENTGKFSTLYRGRPVGGFTLQEDDSLVLFMDKGAIAILDNGSIRYILDEIPEDRKTRFNDVIADPRGRVFCGTMQTSENAYDGRFYRLDTNGTIHLIAEGIGVSNGIGFNNNLDLMYYTDSITGEIYVFDYDIETGNVNNKRVFLKFDEREGVPDGLTVDAEGYVWTALAHTSLIVRYSPNGEMVQQIKFPTKDVTSLIFGGVDYKTIYVTSAGLEDPIQDNPAGAVFKINTDIKGKPEFFSRIE